MWGIFWAIMHLLNNHINNYFWFHYQDHYDLLLSLGFHYQLLSLGTYLHHQYTINTTRKDNFNLLKLSQPEQDCNSKIFVVLKVYPVKFVFWCLQPCLGKVINYFCYFTILFVSTNSKVSKYKGLIWLHSNSGFITDSLVYMYIFQLSKTTFS